MQIEEQGEQMSIFDLDICCGRTCLEHSVVTKEKTSELSWKKWQGLQKKESIFLDLRRENGQTQESYLGIITPLRGESSMPNTGEFLRGDEGFVLSQILMGIRQPKSFLTKINNTDQPTEENVTHLSQILELNPDPKYNLSPKACQGILNRAMKRGKKLPPMLEEALKQVIELSHTKTEKENLGGGKGGLIQEDLATSLRTNNYMTVFQPVEDLVMYQREFGGKVTENPETSPTLEAAMGMGGNNQPIISYAVDMGGGKSACDILEDKSPTLCTTHYGEPAVVFENHAQDGRFNGPLNVSQPISHTFGAGGNNVPLVVSFDRETFNTGQNFAQNLGIYEDGIQPTLVARGPGGVCYQIIE